MVDRDFAVGIPSGISIQKIILVARKWIPSLWIFSASIILQCVEYKTPTRPSSTNVQILFYIVRFQL
jgi:hypothetical protein